MEVVILQRTCGDSYQLNMAIRLEQWSKHEIGIVKRICNENNMSGAQYMVTEPTFTGSIR